MSQACNCTHCPAFRRQCEGCNQPCAYAQCDGACAACPVRCGRHADLDRHLAAVGGPSASLRTSLDLDVGLRSQPPFRLTRYFPQLLNGLELHIPLQRLPDAGVGIAKVLTPGGRVSRRALPRQPGPYNLRAQWRIGEITRLVCIGNDADVRLERLWAAQLQDETFWMRVRVLGFEFATSLNFSIYLDEPRLEHLINVKRTWLTVARMQQTSTLIPIPHLQWATLWDLERQLDYARTLGFHTLTLNLQMAKRQAWGTIEPGLQLIRQQVHREPGRTKPDLRLLFAGVVSLRRLAGLAAMFPTASFTSTTPHFLAQRYVQYQHDGTRLIKEPVDGHPDLILAENVRLFQEFLDSLDSRAESCPPPSDEPTQLTAYRNVTTSLQTRFGYSPAEATTTLQRLATDPVILAAFQGWLGSKELDPAFQGSFPTWPCAEGVPHPTLGQLLGQGLAPLQAFLRLADLAQQVDEEIEIAVGQAGV